MFFEDREVEAAGINWYVAKFTYDGDPTGSVRKFRSKVDADKWAHMSNMLEGALISKKPRWIVMDKEEYDRMMDGQDISSIMKGGRSVRDILKGVV